MKILMNNFPNKYKERVLRQEEKVTYIWKIINLKKLQSLLMESYVYVLEKFKCAIIKIYISHQIYTKYWKTHLC